MQNISMSGNKCSGCDRLCMKSLTVISGVDEERCRQIMDSAVRTRNRKGSFLFREGEPCDGIYLLLSGKVKLCTYDKDGREEIAGIFWAGEMI